MADLLSDLNPEQREAASVTDGPVLIVAGAGTGKTRTLVHRLAHMVRDRGIPARNLLAVTFTNKAAGEMQERVDRLLPDGRSAGATVCTFHALCAQVLRKEIRRLGFEPSFDVLDKPEQRALLGQALSTAGKPAMAQAELLDAISLAKSRNERPEDCAQNDVAQAYAAYQRMLRERGALDFGDLILHTIDLLEEFPEVLEFYRDRFTHILVDEYQDISPAQYRLIQLLAGGRRNLCAVGDADQAIYAFRGASVGIFLDFQRDYPDARVVRLERSYRSTRPILAAAQAVIEKSPERLTKSLAAERGDGPRVRIVQTRDDRDEARFCLNEIKHIIGGTSFTETDADRFDRDAEANWGFSDFAVLFRTNAQGHLLAEEFRRAGVPHQFVGERKPTDYPEVQELMQHLRPLVEPEPSAERDGRTPVHELLRRLVAGMGLKERCEDGADEATDAYDRVLLLIQMASRFARLPPGEALAAFWEELTTCSEQDALDDRADKVALLTLHAAKGLEFPVVFIAGVEEGLLPCAHSEGALTEKEVGEERRLFYVGMTRPRDRLYLVHARSRQVYGERQARSPSPFLADIPDDLLEKVDQTQTDASKPRRKRRKKPRGMQTSLFDV